MPGLRYKIIRSLSPIIIIIVIGLLFSGCGAIDTGKNFIDDSFSSDAEMDEAVETVGEFFDLLIEKDYKRAYGYLSSKDRESYSEQDFIKEFLDVTDIIKVEINWVEVKNNIALVGIDFIDSYDGDEKMYKDIEVSLVKEEDGSWKIVFWD